MIKKEKGIEYEVIKSKKDSKANLMFVHGTGCNKSFLRALAEVFEEYDCYLIDLPGHGNSDNTGYNFDNYIKAISYLTNKLSNVILIGHSLGGTLVAKVASLNLRSVVGAIILNSGASYPKLNKTFLKKGHEGVLDQEYLLEACGHLENEDVQKAMKSMEPAGISLIDLFIDESISIEASLKHVKVPTLILGGEDEILVIPEYVKKLNKLIRNSKLVMIPGGRHMVCVAKKHEVKDLICDFIEKNILQEKVFVER